MATMLSITIDSKIAASCVDRRGERTELAAMLEQIAGNGVGVVIAETANCFARDLVV